MLETGRMLEAAFGWPLNNPVNIAPDASCREQDWKVIDSLRVDPVYLELWRSQAKLEGNRLVRDKRKLQGAQN
jgi:hypothetical protein